MPRKKKIVGADAPAELSPDFLHSVGGRRMSLSLSGRGGDIWDFGYIPESRRTEEQHKVHHDIKSSIPNLAIDGKSCYQDADKVDLTQVWKRPEVKEYLGYEWSGTHQFSGSCVWAGAQNVATTSHFYDVIERGDAEKLYVPFGLLAYGRSRFYLGDRGQGEGSTGSTMAKASLEDGWLDAKQEGLPSFKDGDGIEWGRNAEMSWSDGDAPQTMNLLPESRKRLFKSVAQCRSADDVRESIKSRFPVTCASMYAHDGGRVQGSGKDACLLARRQGSWSHQMSILAWWNHPQFGEIFWLMNQWGKNAHGKCPTGMPPGGVWILKSDVDWICRDEVFSFSLYDGFPAPVNPLDWMW